MNYIFCVRMMLPLSKKHRILTQKPRSSGDPIDYVHNDIIDNTLDRDCEYCEISPLHDSPTQLHQEASHSPPLEIFKKNLIVYSNEYCLVVSLIYKFKRK